MNILEPRKVESSALRRWSKDAFELTGRNFFIWLPFTALFLFLSLLLSPLVRILGFLPSLFVGMLCLGWGVGIAAYADRRIGRKALFSFYNLGKIWAYLGRALPLAVLNNLFIVVGSFVGTTVLVFLSRNAEISVSPSSPTSLSANLLSLIFLTSVGDLLLQNLLANGFDETHIHRLLAMLLLGLTWESSEMLISQGYHLNRDLLEAVSSGSFSILLLLVIILVSLFVPFAAIPLSALGLALYPLVSSFFYVSFRDIYLGVAENVPIRSEKRALVSMPE